MNQRVSRQLQHAGLRSDCALSNDAVGAVLRGQLLVSQTGTCTRISNLWPVRYWQALIVALVLGHARRRRRPSLLHDVPYLADGVQGVDSGMDRLPSWHDMARGRVGGIEGQ